MGLAVLCLEGMVPAAPAPIVKWDFATAGGLPATLATSGAVASMQPTFAGEHASLAARIDEGVGLGCCVQMGMGARGAVPALFRSPGLANGLDGLRKVTVCFWLRAVDRKTPAGRDFLFSCPSLRVFFHEKTKEFPAMDVVGTEGRGTIWATRHSEAISSERWSFYAFTYDADREGENCLSYSGSDTSSARLVWKATGRWGGLAPLGEQPLVLGAGDPTGTGTHAGLADGIAIYGQVLSLEQLEAVRLADLGPQWALLLEKRAEREARERERREEDLAKRYAGPLALVPIDPLSQVFPDRLPEPLSLPEPLATPRGGFVSLQFALRSDSGGVCTLGLEPPSCQGRAMGAKGQVYEVIPVPVEANTNGGSQTAAGRRPSESWFTCLIREAPFEVGEVLVKQSETTLVAGRTGSVAVVLPVPTETVPGVYRGSLTARLGEHRRRVPYELRVHDVTVGNPSAMAVSYWLSPAPEDLTNAKPPAWWSDEHWALLETTARNLRAFGQTHILTPVIKGEYPLTDVVRHRDGSYGFTFDRFDHWVQLFLDSGYQGIQGHHITMWGAVYGTDEATGKRERLLARNTGVEFDGFVAAFFASLRKHLAAKGWLGIYEQHLIDECGDVPRYRQLQALAKKHLAGVRIIDAINRHPQQMGDLVGVPVLSIQYAERLREETDAWRRAGKRVWYYNCCSPVPPMPNRHLDESLVCSRLYPWYGWLFGATGYLNWGGNIYRGASPYATSVGPLPNGSQNPGHPPGDNWHYYPTSTGLVPGLRMLAFREGLLDHTLLLMLAARNPDRAQEIATRLTTGLRAYSRRSADYHAARRALLGALEQ